MTSRHPVGEFHNDGRSKLLNQKRFHSGFWVPFVFFHRHFVKKNTEKPRKNHVVLVCSRNVLGGLSINNFYSIERLTRQQRWLLTLSNKLEDTGRFYSLQKILYKYLQIPPRKIHISLNTLKMYTPKQFVFLLNQIHPKNPNRWNLKMPRIGKRRKIYPNHQFFWGGSSR